MRVERVVVGPIRTNCWLVGDDASGPLLVIDPGAEDERVLATIAGRPVAAIVLTHGHFDHAGAVRALVAATGAPFAIHAADAGRVTSALENGSVSFGVPASAPAPDRLLTEGDCVRAGELDFTVLHLPGHTPGGVALLGGGHLFSGDTLFAGTMGRTDLPGGDSAAMRASAARLVTLPPDTRVHPGHGRETTIERELRVNPFLPKA